MCEGKEAYEFAKKIFPIYRSITGNGVRETIKLLNEYIGASNEFNAYEVDTGVKAFDWTVPKEWSIRNAYIEDEDGQKYAQFNENSLHVMGYSIPVDRWIEYDELVQHIYTQEDQPDAIPYVTSYYKENYGFCLSENEKRKLKRGKYHIFIDSELFDGSLSYADIVFPGTTQEEVLFSTYSCHPSLANDNCSGLALAAELAKYIKGMVNRRYTYRFIFVPETIGAIVYLSQNERWKLLHNNTIAGYTLSCVGDDGNYSIVYSRRGDSFSDRVLKNVLTSKCCRRERLKEYSYLERGSDERQYNAPGIDVPVSGFCRTKYWDFPEYHTSMDNMSFISEQGLQGSFDVMKEVIDAIEHNFKYKITVPCEPQLGKRGLYPTVSKKGGYDEVKAMMDLIGYADGEHDLVWISDKINQPISALIPIIKKLEKENLLVRIKEKL